MATAPVAETDLDLVRRFVELTGGFSTREAGELVGASHARIAAWRAGRVASLRASTRRRLEDYVRGVETGPVLEATAVAALRQIAAIAQKALQGGEPAGASLVGEEMRRHRQQLEDDLLRERGAPADPAK